MASLQVFEPNRTRRWKIVVIIAAIVGGFALFNVRYKVDSSAAGTGSVGYVDVSRLIEDYLAPVVEGPLTAETLRLQAEFEAATRDLGEAQAEEEFHRYQAMLNLVKHELIEKQLPTMNEAIGHVADRQGVDVVLDKQSILYGGVDLTDAVLDYLQRND